METKLLLPNKFRIIGWLIFVPALVTAIILRLRCFDFDERGKFNVFAIVNSDILSKPKFMTIVQNGIIDELLLVMIIIGGLLLGFSRLRNEDEFISKIRYESLVWAVYVNFGVMLLATIFIYGTYYFDVLIANIFTILFFFIVRFHVMLYRLNQSAADEE